MKFRTEIDITPFEGKIDYSSSIMCVGSCFATSIGTELDRVRFRCCVNPMGVLFNPLSIASVIEQLDSGEKIAMNQLEESRDGVWFHYNAHGSLSDQSAHHALERINSAVEVGHKALKGADWVILTLGSAWVYRLKSSGEVVANCHKQPAKLFERELLSVEEVISSLDGLVNGALKGKNIVLTLSPIRHLADGLEQNSLSKATLRVAISQICSRYSSVNYFPSYEILLDDLRDYRYYGEDMVHPSKSAINYIWQLFRQAATTPQTQRRIEQVERIVKAREHRPQRRYSSEYAIFCRRNLELIDLEEGIDLSHEREHFRAELKEISKK